eukprot:COSAG05_NODE_12517_length_465_cov_0.557377_2_plen_118_part_01
MRASTELLRSRSSEPEAVAARRKRQRNRRQSAQQQQQGAPHEHEGQGKDQDDTRRGKANEQRPPPRSPASEAQEVAMDQSTARILGYSSRNFQLRGGEGTDDTRSVDVTQLAPLLKAA